MTFGFGFGFPRMQGVAAAFSPAILFASGEVGAWYDPSDLTTMFTDTAGTTPVTTPGQTVALMLDKSRGLVPGPELVTNGDFATDLSGWSNNISATWETGGALLSATSASAQLAQSFSTVAGRTYRLNYQFVSGNLGNSLVRVGTAANDASIASVGMGAGPGSFSRVFTATGTATWVTLFVSYPSVSINGKWDNISVREIPGNHATQATAASRPTYAIEPMTGRRNLLTWSEGFDNAAWSKSNVTVGADAGVAPNGTTTAEKLTPNTSNTTKFALGSPNYIASTGQGVVYSCYVKADGYNKIALRESASTGAYASFDISTGSVIETGNAGSIVVSNASATSVGNGWYRIAMTCTNSVGAQTNGFGAWPLSASYTTGQPSSQNWTGNGTSGVLIWGAQLELGSTATPYQRVTTQFDVTETGVASKSYLFFDGSDDFMLTGTITPGVDKAQVFAGVRRFADTAGTIAEFSTGINVSVGSLALFTGTNSGTALGNGFQAGSRGTQFSAGVFSFVTGFIPPVTAVISSSHDIMGDLSVVRGNGVAGSSGTSDQGTGNFLAYPLYIGRRGGTTLPFNGHIYGLITRFSAANLDAATITSTETWMNGKTGAYTANSVSPNIYDRFDDLVLDRSGNIIERRA